MKSIHSVWRQIRATPPRWILIAVILSLAVIGVQAAPGLAGRALAHGEAERLELFRGQDGLYQIIVEVQPQNPTIGMLHFSVTPLDIETMLPVDDAFITVIAITEQGKPAFQAPALPAPDSPLYYDANINFTVSGAWSLMVKVESERLGEAEVIMPLDIGVSPFPSGGEGTVVYVIMLAILVGGIAYVWYSARRKLKQRAARA